MKYFFYWLLPYCIFVNVYSQPCNSVNVSLINQNDVDLFLTQNGNCTEITGDMVIGIGIEHLTGLENIQKIGGYLSISNCDNLKDIKGLSGLKEVGSWIRIQNNPELRSLEGLNNLQKAGSDFFYIAGNKHIKNVHPLSSLDSIKGIFQIWNMDSLINLQGLSALKYTGMDFSIFKNPLLQSFEGLNGLQNINGSLRIYENNSLDNINALRSELIIKSQIVLTDNPVLSSCNSPFICSVLAASPNNVLISNNNTNCKNKEEVMNQCISSSVEETYKVPEVYPNPTSGIFIIQNMDSDVRSINIINTTGFTECITLTDNKVDISHLPIGLYFIQIQHRIFKISKL
jgi:hypothetical protein